MFRALLKHTLKLYFLLIYYTKLGKLTFLLLGQFSPGTLRTYQIFITNHLLYRWNYQQRVEEVDTNHVPEVNGSHTHTH